MVGRPQPTSDNTVDLTRRYLSELGSYPLLTAEHEVELAQAIESRPARGDRARRRRRQPDAPRARRAAGHRARADEARRTFIQSNLRLVVSIAKRYQGTGHDAARPHPGGQPRADAGGREVRPPQGLQVLDLRHVVDPPVDRPRHRRQGPHDPAAVPPRRHAWRCCRKASATLLKTLGREPTPAELAEETGMTEERVQVALHAGPDLVSLSVADRRRRRRARRPAWPTTTPRCPSRWPPLSLGARRPAGPARLPQPARARDPLAAVRARAGDQPLTLDEVGRRFNVTRERIRQIEAKALTKLRHPCSARHRRLVDALPLTRPSRVRPSRRSGRGQAAAPCRRPTRRGRRDASRRAPGRGAEPARRRSPRAAARAARRPGTSATSTISGERRRRRVGVDARRPAGPGRRRRPAAAPASTTTAGSPTSSTSRPTSSPHLAAGRAPPASSPRLSSPPGRPQLLR